VIDAKRKRKTIEVRSQEKEPSPAPDLMAALERTLENLRNGDDPRAESQGGERASSSDGAKRRTGKARNASTRAKSTG
jgi:hypothetical protein